MTAPSIIFSVVTEALAAHGLIPLDERLITENSKISSPKNYGSKAGRANVADLAEQITDGGIIHPPVVLFDAHQRYIIISGKKRLAAFRQSQAQKKSSANIQVKLLDYLSLVTSVTQRSPDFAKLPPDEQFASIAAVLQLISYSETAHSSGYTDDNVLRLLANIRDTFKTGNSFSQVMPMLGIKSNESKSYRNTLRLWKIACNDLAQKLIDSGRVKMSLFKKDANMEAMDSKHKQELIYNEIVKYTDRVKADKEKDESSRTAICNLIGYDEQKVETIIRATYFSGSSSQDKQEYEGRTLKYKHLNRRVKIGAISINLDNDSDDNFKKIVDTTFVLRQTLLTLENHIKNNKPIAPGSPKTGANDGARFNFSEKHYALFLNENNLQLYCDIRKIERFYLSTGKRPLLDPIEEATLPGNERKRKMFEVYVARAKYGQDGMSSKEVESRSYFDDDTDKQAS